MEVQWFVDTDSHVGCSLMYVGNVNKTRLIYFTPEQQSVSMPRKAVKKGTKVVLSAEPTNWIRSLPSPHSKCRIYVILRNWLKSLEVERRYVYMPNNVNV